MTALAGKWRPNSSNALAEKTLPFAPIGGPIIFAGASVPRAPVRSVEFLALESIPTSSLPAAGPYLPHARRPFGPSTRSTQGQGDGGGEGGGGGGGDGAGGAVKRGTANSKRGPSSEQPTTYRILDGFLLLDSCGVELPEQAMRADLQDMDIEGVTEEDLAFFSNLCSVDLGENCVPLELLRTLPALQELRLHCNSVRDIGDLGVNGFVKLEVLDLSYNMLEVDAIGRLAALPRLRRLDLTCNQLQSLPLNMAAFGMLQALNLERNDLVDEDVLIGLAAIPHVRVWCTGRRAGGAGGARGGGVAGGVSVR